MQVVGTLLIVFNDASVTSDDFISKSVAWIVNGVDSRKKLFQMLLLCVKFTFYPEGLKSYEYNLLPKLFVLHGG